ncbi:hypothetical protein BKA67DRAFT_586020 [Truncatella angustata]|uniref:Uncharacterized protein n=1 Tax=Truncatella angustata TaxID=152316 RepID=A0A9P8RLY1_9PEZI|nr:uncharacterized protein BKA67DRAFT_586020 [Truncatella angustata]KAH6645655.1 hypothetical protein BKA67DRAFT_586020 [Truncatella angustata]
MLSKTSYLQLVEYAKFVLPQTNVRAALSTISMLPGRSQNAATTFVSGTTQNSQPGGFQPQHLHRPAPIVFQPTRTGSSSNEHYWLMSLPQYGNYGAITTTSPRTARNKIQPPEQSSWSNQSRTSNGNDSLVLLLLLFMSALIGYGVYIVAVGKT